MFPFIVIEGLDGSGKTTLRKALYRLAITLGGPAPLAILTTAYLDPRTSVTLVKGKYGATRPSGTDYVDALAHDKAQVLEELVVPALRERPVIADRWMLSDIAQLGVRYDVSTETAYEVYADRLKVPATVTILLRIEPAVAVDRARGRAGADSTHAQWDTTNTQVRVYELHQKVLSGQPLPLLGDVVLIEAARRPELVLLEAWRALDRYHWLTEK